jgi:hypothetical protein
LAGQNGVSFDVAGKPRVPKPVSYHKVSNKLDERGNVIEEAHFDAAGHLIRKSDKHSNLVYQADFDVAGKPILNKDGYHKYTAKSDENGHLIEKAYFDKHGNQIQSLRMVPSKRSIADELAH